MPQSFAKLFSTVSLPIHSLSLSLLLSSSLFLSVSPINQSARGRSVRSGGNSSLDHRKFTRVVLCWLLSARFDDSTWLCSNWTKLRARVSSVQWREQSVRGKLVWIIWVGRNERSIVSFIFLSIRGSIRLSLSLVRFGKQDQRWADAFCCFTEIFRRGTMPRKHWEFLAEEKDIKINSPFC